MLCPVALDAVGRLEEELKQAGTDDAEIKRPRTAVMMGIGYAANMGGTDPVLELRSGLQ
jgi:hypothetical protein